MNLSKTPITTLKMKLFASLGLLLVVGLVAFGSTAASYQNSGESPKVVVEGDYIEASGGSEGQPGNETLGASAGPDNPYLWQTNGGVRQWYGSMAMNTATTTVCAIQSPVVTSSLDFASGVFDITSSTAGFITLAKSATPFVTTTLLATDVSFAANSKAYTVASTTQAINDQRIFAPSQYLVVSMRGGNGDFSPGGFCKAVWTSLY